MRLFPFIQISNMFLGASLALAADIEEVIIPPQISIIETFNGSKNTRSSTCSEFTQANQAQYPSFSEVEFKDLNIPAPYRKYSHQLKPTLVLLKGSGWTEEEVIAHAKRAAEVLAQCGILLNSARLIVASAPHSTVDVDTNKGDRLLASLELKATRPLVFFVRDNPEGYYAYSWAKRDIGDSALTNTAWLTHKVNEEYKSKHDLSYDVLAHEIGHLLCNCGHVHGDKKNLMADKIGLLNDHISPKQCRSFRKGTSLEKL